MKVPYETILEIESAIAVRISPELREELWQSFEPKDEFGISAIFKDQDTGEMFLRLHCISGENIGAGLTATLDDVIWRDEWHLYDGVESEVEVKEPGPVMRVIFRLMDWMMGVDNSRG